MTRLERTYHRHAYILGYIALVAGLVGAILMIQYEVDERADGDRIIETRIDKSDRQRISDNEQTIAALTAQVEQTKRINMVQNQILRALLAAERKDPKLFNGVDLPALSTLLDGEGGGTETGTPTGSPSKGGGSGGTGGQGGNDEGTSPPGNGGGNNGHPHPSPSTHPDPVRPNPVHPTPVDPTPRPPAPARPGPVGQIVEPVTEIPAVGPVVEPIVEPVVAVVDGLLQPAESSRFNPQLAASRQRLPIRRCRPFRGPAAGAPLRCRPRPRTAMSATARPHYFVAGRDMIERCTGCHTTRTKAGLVIPAGAPCPALSPAAGIRLADQYLSPLDALLADICGASSLAADDVRV